MSQSLRTQISQIFVANNLRTDQKAIGEIEKLINKDHVVSVAAAKYGEKPDVITSETYNGIASFNFDEFIIVVKVESLSPKEGK